MRADAFDSWRVLESVCGVSLAFVFADMSKEFAMRIRVLIAILSTLPEFSLRKADLPGVQ